MKNMRKVDSNGRVTLPLAVRQAIGVKAGDALDVISHGDSGICRSCAEKISKKIAEVTV